MVENRSLLADRIQIVVSPYYSDISEDDFFDYRSMIQLYFSKDVQKDLGTKIDRHGKTPAVIVPKSLMHYYPSCFNHVRMSAYKPYSVTAEFNFIRFIRAYAMQTLDFNFNYDDSVRVNEDNFINFQNWSDYDQGLVSYLGNCLTDVFSNFANEVWSILLPENKLLPCHYSISKLEFNKEFFVGSGNSLSVLRSFMKFIHSDKGRSFIHELQALGVNTYKASDIYNNCLNAIDTDKGQTFKFYMGKGVWFKIYRKTTDHVRCEVGFESSYIKRKFGSRSFDKVFDRLRIIADEIIKRSNVEYFIYNSVDTDKSFEKDRLSDFLDNIYPNFSSICNNVSSNTGISDPACIELIRKNPRFRSLFTSKLVKSKGKNGYVYLYDPLRTLRKAQHWDMVV